MLNPELKTTVQNPQHKIFYGISIKTALNPYDNRAAHALLNSAIQSTKAISLNNGKIQRQGLRQWVQMFFPKGKTFENDEGNVVGRFIQLTLNRAEKGDRLAKKLLKLIKPRIKTDNKFRSILA